LQECLEGNVYKELSSIELGSQYKDPQYKDHSLVFLVNNYNRLFKRVDIPAGVISTCPASGLDIDTVVMHSKLESLNISERLPDNYYAQIDEDLRKIKQQQICHEQFAPVRLCSLRSLLTTNEPWKLVRLQERKPQ
jgi:hypothetical protein